MEEKDIIIIRNLLKWLLPILSFYTLIILLKFTWLHLIYFPEEIELFKKEYFLLFASLFIFISSLYYKLKISLVFSAICIIVALVNIVGFTIAAAILYRELMLKQFI